MVDWSPRERWVKAAGAGEVEPLGNLGGVMKVLETVEDADQLSGSLSDDMTGWMGHPAGSCVSASTATLNRNMACDT